MDIKLKVLAVMCERAAQEERALGGKYPFRMATLNIRCAMEDKHPGERWDCASLRKALTELSTEGFVSKCPYGSRIGQAVWKLEVRYA